MKPLIGILAVLFYSAVSVGSASAQPKPESNDSVIAESKSNLHVGLSRVIPILDAAHMGARIYYSADACPVKSWTPYSVPFPRLKLRPSSTEGRQAVQGLFAEDERVHVTNDASGIVRIAIGDVQREILGTNGLTLNFSGSDQYDPTLAIVTIMQNKKVKTAERQLGLRELTATYLDVIAPEPQEGLPHLPPSLENVTLDQALDTVARTFGGAIVYGVCPNEGFFEVNYFR